MEAINNEKNADIYAFTIVFIFRLLDEAPVF